MKITWEKGILHIMKRFKWFALFAALILLLAACGNQDKDQSAEKNGSKDSYTVKHAMGTATIDGTPKKSSYSRMKRQKQCSHLA